MKMLGRMAMLLVVLGYCLPSDGRILVYKLNQSSTFFRPADAQGEVVKERSKAYLIIDVNDANDTIMHAEAIDYGVDPNGTKRFEQDPLQLELVRVDDGTRVQWVVTQKEVTIEGNEITGGSFYTLTGLARDRNVGTGVRQEAANKLSGFGLADQTQDGQRTITMATVSATLFPRFTIIANGTGEGEGNQDFDTSRQLIKDFLTDRGYVEQEGDM